MKTIDKATLKHINMEKDTLPMSLYRAPSMEEIEKMRNRLNDRRRRKRIWVACLFFLIVSLLFCIAWCSFKEIIT